MGLSGPPLFEKGKCIGCHWLKHGQEYAGVMAWWSLAPEKWSGYGSSQISEFRHAVKRVHSAI